MKRILAAVAIAIAGLVGTASAAVITQWTFEGDVITPATGSGTASNIGGTTYTFAAGNSGGRGWNTSAYPNQSTNSGTAGVQFLVSTVGYQNIQLAFDHRASGTASRWAQVQYTTDGSTWNVFGNNGGGLSPHDTFYSFSFDLSAITAANNNANFGVRIVSIFSPVAFDTNDPTPANREIYGADVAYHRARVDGGSGGAYGTTGTWRFDNVTISGDVIPEPGTAALVALGLGAGALIRRRRAA